MAYFKIIVAFLLVAASQIEAGVLGPVPVVAHAFAPAVAPVGPISYARVAPYNIPPFAASVNSYTKSVALPVPIPATGVLPPYAAPVGPAVAPAIAPGFAPAFNTAFAPAVAPAYPRAVFPAPYAPAYPAAFQGAIPAAPVPVAGPVPFGAPLPLPLGRSVHAVSPAAPFPGVAAPFGAVPAPFPAYPGVVPQYI